MILVFYAIILEECQYFADPFVHVVLIVKMYSTDAKVQRIFSIFASYEWQRSHMGSVAQEGSRIDA